MKLLLPLLMVVTSLNLFAQDIDRTLFATNEWEKLKGERDLADRLKVYIQTSNRYLDRMRQETEKQDEEGLQNLTAAFSQLIETASKEIVQSPEKKKSKKLKKFEIALRENVFLLKNIQARAPMALHDRFSDVIGGIEKIRKQVLNIIFDKGL